MSILSGVFAFCGAEQLPTLAEGISRLSAIHPKLGAAVLQVLRDPKFTPFLRDVNVQRMFNPVLEVRYIALAPELHSAGGFAQPILTENDVVRFINDIVNLAFLILGDTMEESIFILAGTLIGMKEVDWKPSSLNSLSLSREPYAQCQNLIVEGQYKQAGMEAQKLPEPLKTAACIQLLQPPAKKEALNAARELISTLSDQSQPYCQCLLAFAEGNNSQAQGIANTLTDGSKASICAQLFAQGKVAEAQEIMKTVSQEPAKTFCSCLDLLSQGKDFAAILQAQKNLPDAYIPMLCGRFLQDGKMAEAMLLAKNVKDPLVMQVLCKEFLVAGSAVSVLELARLLPNPEMQSSICQMLLLSGCVKEAMEIGLQLPCVQQMALFQLLLEKNPDQSLPFMSQVLQDPSQAKQLIQMLMEKGRIAEAKQFLRLVQDLALAKELACLLAAQTVKKCASSSLDLASEEEDSSSDDGEESLEGDEKEEEKEEESSEQEDAQS
ncbi:MAG: hypothetical protein K2Y01_07265 [Rhabdochlamydiaceae bacterium]|nr:hypothetical protein [Rhabdochlamydiaceae bacterium]